jgi:hypothetical protein
MTRLPELVELEKDRNKASSRRKQPLRIQPVTIGDLIREGKLLEVHCGNCRPARHLYIDAGSLDLPRRMPVLGAGQPSRLQRLWRQEQRHPSSDLGQAECQSARGDRPLSGFSIGDDPDARTCNRVQ